MSISGLLISGLIKEAATPIFHLTTENLPPFMASKKMIVSAYRGKRKTDTGRNTKHTSTKLLTGERTTEVMLFLLISGKSAQPAWHEIFFTVAAIRSAVINLKTALLFPQNY